MAETAKPSLVVWGGMVGIHHAGGGMVLPEAEACRRLLLWPELLAALEGFVDYYDQAGMPAEPTEEVEDDPSGGFDSYFDGDEVFNVRLARAALAKAKEPTP